MKLPIPALTLGLSLFLAACASLPRAGRPLPPSSAKCSMSAMLLALNVWESPDPAPFIAATYPGGVPEDYVSLDYSGVQADIQALRLDSSTLAVAIGSQLYGGETGGIGPDGKYHPEGSKFVILRRSENRLADLTSTVFPFPIAKHSMVELTRNGTVVVTEEDKTRSQVYYLRYNRFVKVAKGGAAR